MLVKNRELVIFSILNERKPDVRCVCEIANPNNMHSQNVYVD